MNQIVHLIISIVFSAVSVAVLAYIALNGTKGTDMAANVMFSSSLDIMSLSVIRRCTTRSTLGRRGSTMITRSRWSRTSLTMRRSMGSRGLVDQRYQLGGKVRHDMCGGEGGGGGGEAL
jgi:hypothetical protein